MGINQETDAVAKVAQLTDALVKLEAKSPANLPEKAQAQAALANVEMKIKSIIEFDNNFNVSAMDMTGKKGMLIIFE